MFFRCDVDCAVVPESARRAGTVSSNGCRHADIRRAKSCQDPKLRWSTAGHEYGGVNDRGIGYRGGEATVSRSISAVVADTPLSRLARADSGTAQCCTPDVGEER